MGENNLKVDISSTAIEKGIDLAKNFLEKLVSPAVEEVGVLIREQVTNWRFKNQIKILNKAQEICIRNNIRPKAISLKLLCPLLENASLEEDEFLSDRWANLLANLVDSEQNIQNHVFPYILSQISKNEFIQLEVTYNEKYSRIFHLEKEYEEYTLKKDEYEYNINIQLNNINKQIEQLRECEGFNPQLLQLYKEMFAINERKSKFSNIEDSIQKMNTKLKALNIAEIQSFELSNLMRLALVKEDKQVYANSQTLQIPNDRFHDESYTRVDLDIDVTTDIDYVLTEFGELFIKACKEKN